MDNGHHSCNKFLRITIKLINILHKKLFMQIKRIKFTTGAMQALNGVLHIK